jgi:transcriptional regulator with XRE-family HTH domain
VQKTAVVIRARRVASGLSLNRLAELTRLSRQMISFIEINERIPTIDTEARISRVIVSRVANCWRKGSGGRSPTFSKARPPVRAGFGLLQRPHSNHKLW